MPLPTSAPVVAASALHLRWSGRDRYTVLQTGCGTGEQLRQLWCGLSEQPDAPRCLHYLIIEPQPPTRQQLASWFHDDTLLAPLIAAWPPLTPGCHRLVLLQGRVVLTLVIGTVATSLMQVEAGAGIDLFLLSSLPDDAVWSAGLLKRLGQLAAPQAQLLAAASLAGQDKIQAGLAAAGFVPEDAVQPAVLRFSPRWQASAAAQLVPAAAIAAPILRDRRAIVIGAGLAGSAACESLAMRGWQVVLIEQHAQAAQEASGNLAGVYMPAISRDDNPTARLTRAAFLFAQQVWQRIGIADEPGMACGVLQVARDAAQAEAFEQAARHWQYPPDYAQWLSASEASARLGMATGSGWFFPSGGWLRPGAVCEALLQACGDRLQRRFQGRATSLQRRENVWQVSDADGKVIEQAPVLILANGVQSLQFEQTASLPLQSMRGQVSHVPAALLPALPFVLCGDGYLTGMVDGVISVGASYDQDHEPGLRLDSHVGNLAKLGQLLPRLSREIDAATLGGRVGFRCVSADRLPLAGALPDLAALAAGGEVRLAALPRLAQLYGLLGYASRGLIWAPLAAEILACQLEGEPAPLGRDLLALLDPARFALKAHRQRGH